MSFKLKAVAAAALAIGTLSTATALTIVGNSPTTLASEVLTGASTTVSLNPIGFNSTVQGVVSGNNYTLKLTLSAGVWAATAATVLAHYDPSSGLSQNMTVVSGLGTNAITLAPTGAVVVGPALPLSGMAIAAIVAPAALSSTASNTLFKFDGLQAVVTSADFLVAGVNDDGCGPLFKGISVKGQYLNNSGTEVDLPVGTLNQSIIIIAQEGIKGGRVAVIPPVIDVTSPSLNKLFVAGTGITTVSAPIASYLFFNNSGNQSDNAAVPADYVIGGALWTDAGQSIILNASNGFATGATFSVTNTGTCPGLPLAGVSAVITGNQAVLTVPATPGITSVANMLFTVCYNVTGAADIPASNITGYAKANRTNTGTTLPDFAFGQSCLAAFSSLKLNGGMIKVRNYSGASLVPFGWKQYTRIINSGATATPISGYFQYGDGTQSAAAVLVPTIAAGGNVTLSNIAIEALLPLDTTKTTTTNARLVITSNNDSIRVQNYQVTPNTERWMESSGGQDDMATHTQQ